jgi:uncharacterized glyoxalase superfamily protein PhnB
MNPKKLVPIVITEKLQQVKAYYVEHFGFSVDVENEQYLGLKAAGDAGIELSFMAPEGDALKCFEGQGVIHCFEVEDVDAEYERLRQRGLVMVQPPQDNPWGDRSTITVDPVGINIYIYRPIAAGK